jgi:signal transduction histidine kinase
MTDITRVGRVPLTILRYGSAAAAFALVVGASAAVRRQWGINVDATPVIILLMIATAWFGGLGPGLVVAAMLEAVLDYNSFPPANPTRFAVVAFNRLILFTSVVVFASARRRAEERMSRQQQALRETIERERKARAEAEAASRLKDEFLATVSHELRTPLNGILGWASILTRHDVDDKTKEQALRTIERNALAQSHIVEDILDFSGMARGRLRIDPEPVEFAKVVREAVDTVFVSAAAKHVVIEIALKDSPIVVGDADRLRQIVWNLLSNAVKFTPSGGRITVRLQAVDGAAQLQVEDTGIGIDPAFLPHAFDAFRQADSSFTRVHGGLGLGLAIVRHLVELHGGTIVAQSAGIESGAVFTLRLPLAPAETRPPSPHVGETAAQRRAVTAGSVPRRGGSSSIV